jgi:large subunit ribosomal protein L23
MAATQENIVAENVIIRPLLSEKSNRLQHSRNTYTFVVSPDAAKPDIKAAIEKLYSVKVADVRTIVRKGKARRNKVGYIYATNVKRALVTLEPENKIELF